MWFQAVFDHRQILEIPEKWRNADHHDRPVYRGDVGALSLPSVLLNVGEDTQRQQRILQDGPGQNPAVGVIGVLPQSC